MDDTRKIVFLQTLEVILKCPVLVVGCCCCLSNGERQTAKALGQRICDVTIIGFGDLEEVVDRLVSIKDSDLDGVPSLMFPTCVVRCRYDDA